ncbi:MAG: aminoacyl-tRNA hydrolase [Pirellulaceae bacterium]|nr:aminoacyl-tRNA hydrolase [Pirellulaceae bacterium]
MSGEECNLFLVVGLGNPGSKYRQTRHNIGFECLDELSQRMGSPTPTTKFEGQFVRGKRNDRELILLWPLTYMNASGRSVAQTAGFFKIPVDRVLIVCDDMSLPLGKLRIRKRGSSGGQKGLGDILKSLGTQDVPRLRLGIDQAPPNWDVADFVLSKFRSDERTTVDQAIGRAVDAIEHWISSGIESCMNEFNRELE